MAVFEQGPATESVRGQFPSTPAQAPRASRREVWVATLAGAALVVPPWLVGAWTVWSQWVTLALALLAFAALFTPVFDYRAWPLSTGPAAMARRLVRFPVFWLGFAILTYGVIAWKNPWLILTSNTWQGWWMAALEHAHWLPRSVETPFWEMNAGRALLVIAPAWLVVCAIWTGIETAGSLHALLRAVAINGVLLAGFGLLERASGTHAMFWVYDPHPEYVESTFFGSFVYSGHAGAWLLVAYGAVLGQIEKLSIRQYGRTVFLFWVPGAVLIWLALFEGVFIPYGFLVPWFTLILISGINFMRSAKWMRAIHFTAGAVGIVLLVLMVGRVWALGGERVNPYEPSLKVRYAIARTSATMIPDEWFWGWGPGSYRYICPYYLKQNPLFTEPGQPDVLRYRANYAHSDWVQAVMEWGVAGAALFGAVLVWWVVRVWQLRHKLPVAAWCVLAAVGLVLILAALDFPLQNTAVLLVVVGMLGVVVKLGETGEGATAYSENL